MVSAGDMKCSYYEKPDYVTSIRYYIIILNKKYK